jgi:ribosome biogenesis GTPase
MYLVCTETGEVTAQITGRLRHEASTSAEFPAVGDWVVLAPGEGEGVSRIHAVLPRRTKFSRRAPDGSGRGNVEQVLAANVDVAFLVSGLDGGRNFNLRRTERYLTLAWESGAEPVIVLNKVDVCEDVAARVHEIGTVAPGVPVHPVSALDGEGVAELATYLPPGKTGVFMGPSGVGKSSLINALLGEERLTIAEVRDDDREGRHTTTWRELIRLPVGGLIIDTPGMRELRLWCDEEGLKTTFEDVEALAAQCRFGDCRHQSEPGCAVQQALADGTLDAGRYASYLKLQREEARTAARRQLGARQAEKRRWKKVTQSFRQRKKVEEKYRAG